MTEMWERYGFYVVQTLLALYLALYFKWPDKQVYALVGSFTALTYISPVLGGWIADHLIGQKRSTLLGAVFLFTSYILLTFHASGNMLTAALSGIAVGTGLLKSTISSLLGNEYPENSPHRESGFTIFYMGITAGIILGTTLPSILNTHFGWSTSFSSAALGILFAFIIFSWGIRRYTIQDYRPFQFEFKKINYAALLIIFLWCSAYLILSYPVIANTAFLLTALISLTYLGYCAYQEPKVQALKTCVIALLCAISIIFWAFYFQMFLSFTLFITRVVNPKLMDITFPAPYFVAIQSLGMIIIGSVLSQRKTKIDVYEQAISSGNKFLLAIVINAVAYACIAFSAHLSMSTNSLLSPLFIIPAYLAFSFAELFLSPVGLCAITILSSRKKVSTMMGIFFVSLGIGGFLAGKLATLTAVSIETAPLSALKMHYALSFLHLFELACGAVIISFGLNYMIRILLITSKRKASDIGSDDISMKYLKN